MQEITAELIDVGYQGRGRTADLPLFRRLCRSMSVHHPLPGRPGWRLALAGVQDRSHVSRTVVSTVLARSRI
jgi:hypothetical protein